MEIEFVPGHVQTKKRGIVFLKEPDLRFVIAFDQFHKLSKTCKKQFHKGIGYWIDGIPRKKRHHGWDKSEHNGKYTDCYVFKCNDNNSRHRFYGFLFHPLRNDPSYQLCVLVTHATKDTQSTDVKNLDKVCEAKSVAANFIEREFMNIWNKERTRNAEK